MTFINSTTIDEQSRKTEEISKRSEAHIWDHRFTVQRYCRDRIETINQNKEERARTEKETETGTMVAFEEKGR